MVATQEVKANTDITTAEHVKVLVDLFYGKVREHAVLGPIFNEVIRDRWPAHLETMNRFWSTVLLGEGGYAGRPFPPHAKLPINSDHFDTWLELFCRTVDELFTGETANEAKWRAGKMAVLFLSKIEYIRANPGKLIY